ncbi:MAG: XrtA/PEP-CTERM system TPR-repeat protein PrsT [Gammaproteobacteria bacterium]
MPTKSGLLRALSTGSLILLLAACGSGVDEEEAFASARASFEAGQLGSAMVELKTILQANPDYAPARALLGEAALLFGEGSSALKELGVVVEAGAADPHVLFTYANALVFNGEYDEALRFAKENAKTIPSMIIYGEANLGLGQAAAAKAAFESALETGQEPTTAHLGLGRLAYVQGAMEQARSEVDAALQATPTSIEAWLLAGDIATAQNDFTRAQAAYDKALEVDPYDQSRFQNLAHVALAMLALFQNDPDGAAPHIAAVRKANPKHPRYYYLNGLLLFEKERFEEAQTELLEVLKQVPAHAGALTMSGIVSYRRGDLNQAREYLERALVSRPDSTYLRKSLGAIYARLGLAKDAIDKLEPLAKENPDDAELQRMLGGAYLAAGRSADATAALERAMRLNPADLNGVTSLAVGYLAQNDVDKAVSELSTAVEQNSDYAMGKYLLAATQLKQGNVEAARAAAEQLVEERPQDALYANLLGVIEQVSGDMDKARASFERALGIDPSFLPAAMNVARLDVAANDWDAAEKQFQHMLEVDPAHIGALNALAVRRVAEGRMDDAIGFLERLRAAAPADVSSRLLLAQARFQQGRIEESLDVTREVLSLAPENLTARLFAARGELYEGNLETARAHARAALEQAPEMFESNYLAAIVELRSGNEERARELLRKATAISPDVVVARDVLSRLDPKSGGKAGPTAVDGAVRLRELASSKQIKEALAVARAQAAAHPDDSNAQFLVAAAHMAAGDVAAARKSVEEVLAATPDNLAAMINLARIETIAGEIEAARGWYRKILEHEPDHLAALLDLARLSPPTEADALIRKAYAADPQSDAVMMAMVDNALSREDPAAAAPILDQLYRRAPFDGDVLNLAVRTYLGLGKLTEASAAATTFAERFPARVDANILHGVVYLVKGDRNLARRALTQATELEPANTVPRAMLAQLEFDTGQLDAAREQLAALDKLGYRSPETSKLKADIAWRGGDKQAAVALYRQAWEASPGAEETAAYARGRWSTGERDAAHELLLKALAAPDAAPALHEVLGDMYYAEGQHAAAAEQYRALLDATPDNAVVLDKLAELYEILGDERAFATAQRAQELAPDDPQILATYGWLLVKSGQVERGQGLIERALAKGENAFAPVELATTRFHLATAYRQSGKKAAERRELTALIESGVDFPERDVARRLLER